MTEEEVETTIWENGFQNYSRLTLLLDEVNPLLRKIFRTRFPRWMGGTSSSKWEDTDDIGTKFFKKLPKKWITLDPEQEKRVKSGQVDEWDTTLLRLFLIHLDYNGSDAEKVKDQAENERIKLIIKVRNDHAHFANKKSMLKTEFHDLWDRVIQPLIELGGDSQAFEKIRTSDFASLVGLTTFTRIWFNVDDPVDPFTGRKDFLNLIHTTIQNNAGLNTVQSQIQIISGLGGIGKTQLARRYVQEYKNNYHNVIWINADSFESSQNSFFRLAQQLDISTQCGQEKFKDVQLILSQIYDRLFRHVTLVIFDNAENYLDGSAPLKPFLPPATPPKMHTPFVLVTSRNEGDWGPIDVKNVISLTTFEEHEIIELIRVHLGFENTPENRTEVLKLGHMLGGLPLTLQQAVAYIRNENKKSRPFTIQSYCDKYQQVKGRLKLLKFPPLDSRITVYTTWRVTLDKIGRMGNGQLALQVLNILSFLDPDNIPYKFLVSMVTAILIENQNEQHDSDSDDSDENDIDGSLLLLKNYNLINIHQDFTFISIHRQVQDVTLENLKMDKEVDKILNSLVQSCQKILESPPPPADPSYRQILKNLNKITKNFNLLKNVPADHLDLKLKLALKFQNIGSHTLALEMLLEIEATQKNQQKEMADGDKTKIAINILTTHHHIACVLTDQSKFAEALELFDKVYQSRVILLGTLHPDTIGTKYEKANLLKNQSKYDDALKLYLEVVDERREILQPENHPDLLSTRHNTAVVMEMQENYKMAMEIYSEVLEDRLKYFEPDHPDILTSQNHIARLHSSQKRFEKSLQMYETVYENRCKILGPHHPDSLKTRNYVARTLGELHRYDEAFKIYAEVYEIRKENLGLDHYDTLTTRQNWAWLLVSHEQFEEGLGMYREVFEIRKLVLPKDHPDLLGTWHNIARVLDSLDRLDDSLKMYAELYEVRKKFLGEEHTESLRTRFNMGRVLDRQGKFWESLQVYEEVGRIREKIFAKKQDHPDLLAVRGCIANLKNKVFVIE